MKIEAGNGRIKKVYENFLEREDYGKEKNQTQKVTTKEAEKRHTGDEIITAREMP